MKIDDSRVLPHVISVGSDGTPCFTGTHVPVRALMDHLAKGYTIYEFMVGFPTVRRQQVIGFLELAAGNLVAAAASQSDAGSASV